MQRLNHFMHEMDEMHCEQGFTLIELLISMSMGLVLIAGLSSIFIADSNTSRAISSRTERMGDLFLASHLMQQALRESKSVPFTTISTPTSTPSILTNLNARKVALPSGYPSSDATFTALPYWDAKSQTITYQTLEGNVGIFHYQHNKKDDIYWLRPITNIKLFAELIRDLDTTSGMTVYDPASNKLVKNPNALGGGMRIDLKSAYSNQNKQNSSLSLSFMVWPRN